MWIEGLNLAPKSKGHVRSVMHILFEWGDALGTYGVQPQPDDFAKAQGTYKASKAAACSVG
jgi:hypothetical protein